METLAQIAHTQTVRYQPNNGFTQAVLFLKDGSHLLFEHSSRQNRWAKASATQTTADSLCQALRQFRLNAKHLQLYFEDGTDVEFFASPPKQV